MGNESPLRPDGESADPEVHRPARDGQHGAGHGAHEFGTGAGGVERR
jgi:hypothetical protein